MKWGKGKCTWGKGRLQEEGRQKVVLAYSEGGRSLLEIDRQRRRRRAQRRHGGWGKGVLVGLF